MLLQVLAFLAVSLLPNSLIRHGYLAFHGYFLKASEVCFAACMGLIAGTGSGGRHPSSIRSKSRTEGRMCLTLYLTKNCTPMLYCVPGHIGP